MKQSAVGFFMSILRAAPQVEPGKKAKVGDAGAEADNQPGRTVELLPLINEFASGNCEDKSCNHAYQDAGQLQQP